MDPGDDAADRYRGAGATDHRILLHSMDGGSAVPDPEIGLPRGGSSFRAVGAVDGLRGGVPDRGLANLVRLPDGPQWPGDGLRGDLRSGGMEIGVGDGASPGAAADSTAVVGDDSPDRAARRLCEPAKPTRSARRANDLAGNATDVRPRHGLERLWARCSGRHISGHTCVGQQGVNAWARERRVAHIPTGTDWPKRRRPCAPSAGRQAKFRKSARRFEGDERKTPRRPCGHAGRFELFEGLKWGSLTAPASWRRQRRRWRQ